MLLSPFGRRVHEPWSMAISRRLRQRYGFDGQVYAADDGIVIQLPDGDGHIPAQDLFLFDPEDLKADVERQVGESVLFAARFRECAARSLFMPRSDPGRRVPLWQQRLRAAQLLQSARMAKNFPAAAGNRARMFARRIRHARPERGDDRIASRHHYREGRGNRVAIAFRREHSLWLRRRGDVPV